MGTFSSTVKYAVIVRDTPPFKHPWYFESLEEAERQVEKCRQALKDSIHSRIELVELVRVA